MSADLIALEVIFKCRLGPSPAWSEPDRDPHRHQPSRFEAIAKTLPLGSVAYEPAVEEGGLRYIWLEPRWLDRLKSYRGPGESYSDVILRLAGEG